MKPELEGKDDAEVRRLLPRLLDQPPAPVMVGGPGQEGRNPEEVSPASGSNGVFGRSMDSLYSSKVWSGNGKH
jgi:hypothetical protein